MTPDRVEELSMPLVEAILAECETDEEACDALVRLCVGTLSSVFVTFINPDTWGRVSAEIASETVKIALKVFASERDAESEGETEK